MSKINSWVPDCMTVSAVRPGTEARIELAEIMMGIQYRSIEEYSSYLDQAERFANQNNLPYLQLTSPDFQQYSQRSSKLKERFPDATQDQLREFMVNENMGL